MSTIAEDLKNGIGASESAAVMGVSPWASPMDIYLTKIGEKETEVTEPMNWGTRLEAAIADEFAERNKVDLRRMGFRQHKDAPWFCGHLDRKVQGKNELVEIKTTGIWGRDEWGEEGTDNIPRHYIVQVQHYMRLTGYPIAHVAVLIGGNEYRQYLVEEDHELQQMIFDADMAFWHDHVLPRVPPQIDGSDAATAYILKKHPRETDGLREATEEEVILLGCLRNTIKEKKLTEDQLKDYQNQIKAAIGDAEGIFSNGNKVTWKRTKDSVKTDWSEVAGHLWGLIEAAGIQNGATLQALADKFTITKKGSRRFLPTFKD